MANLFTGRLVYGDYVNLETATGLTLQDDTKYTIQAIGAPCFIREGSVGLGFRLLSDDVAYLTKQANLDVYVKPAAGGTLLNIADSNASA